MCALASGSNQAPDCTPNDSAPMRAGQGLEQPFSQIDSEWPATRERLRTQGRYHVETY